MIFVMNEFLQSSFLNWLQEFIHYINTFRGVDLRKKRRTFKTIIRSQFFKRRKIASIIWFYQ